MVRRVLDLLQLFGRRIGRPNGLVAEWRVEWWGCSHWTYLLSFCFEHALSIRNPGKVRGISEEIFGSATGSASRDSPIAVNHTRSMGLPRQAARRGGE